MIWTGGLNRPHELQAEVGFYDTTLRDGEQTVGVVLMPEEKLEIARALSGAGVGRIEAGFPRVSEDDWQGQADLRGGAGRADLGVLASGQGRRRGPRGARGSGQRGRVADLRAEAARARRLAGGDAEPHPCGRRVRGRERHPRRVLRGRLDGRRIFTTRRSCAVRAGGRGGLVDTIGVAGRGGARWSAAHEIASGRIPDPLPGTTTSASRPRTRLPQSGGPADPGTVKRDGRAGGNANLGE